MTNATLHSPERRRFLKGIAAGAAATAAFVAAGPVAAYSGEDPVEVAVGILIDLTRCTGCNACTLACQQARQAATGSNDKVTIDALPLDAAPFVPPTAISADARTYVDERFATDRYGNDFAVFVKRQCMHCVRPACASACTVGALRKTAEGPVVYDSGKCIGCRYCQYACPFGLPAYDWDNPLGLISKCELCTERLAVGEQPACAASCPNGALRFGKRSELLVQAHAQIASNPGRYVNHVYGEHEVGGTSILYLAPVPFSALGFPSLDDGAIPRYAEAVMVKTPVVALTVAALAVAFQRLTRHHGEHAAFEPSADQHPSAESSLGDQS